MKIGDNVRLRTDIVTAEGNDLFEGSEGTIVGWEYNCLLVDFDGEIVAFESGDEINEMLEEF